MAYGVAEIVMPVVLHSTAALPLPIQIYAAGFLLREQAKSSAPTLGSRSRLTSLSPTSDAAAVAATPVSGAQHYGSRPV
jgi:hypothetical protein